MISTEGDIPARGGHSWFTPGTKGRSVLPLREGVSDAHLRPLVDSFPCHKVTTFMVFCGRRMSPRAHAGGDILRPQNTMNVVTLWHGKESTRGRRWASDTPSRSGRTLLPFVPGVNQECPP